MTKIIAKAPVLCSMFNNFTFPDQYSQIEDKIFLGGIKFALNEENIRKHNISHIVCILSKEEMDIYASKHKNVTYLYIEARDHEKENISQHFKKAASFIENALNSGTGVLIHCMAGVSRSPTILASFYILKRKKDAVQALSFIQLSRSIRPNDGFLHQLENLQ
jgi:protein-tyrosine phosphatase